jgi:outer membrane lipoprotein carrier protein
MKKLLLSLAPAVLLVSTAWADATDDLLDRLQTLKSMKGQFEQVVLDQGGTHMQEATGRFQVARGNQFYWLTETPYEQMAASDGETVWVSVFPSVIIRGAKSLTGLPRKVRTRCSINWM